MNGKRSKELRRLARQVTKGMPAREYGVQEREVSGDGWHRIDVDPKTGEKTRVPVKTRTARILRVQPQSTRGAEKVLKRRYTEEQRK